MRRLRVFLITVCIQILVCGLSLAEFEYVGVGARPLGMGSAFTGLADDAHSIYYNPAGLGSIGQKTFTMGHNKLYRGLSDKSSIGNSFAGYVQPFGNEGSLGAGILSFGVSGLYTETMIILSYGRDVSKMLPTILTVEDLSGVYAGASIKFLNKGYNKEYTGSGETVFNKGDSKSGVAADFGALYRYNYNFSFGLVLTDLVAPDMGLKEQSPLSRGLKLGGRYGAPFINVVFDLVLKNGNFGPCLGMEKWFMEGRFALRAGLGASLSVGASYRFREDMTIDYAYNNPITGIKGTLGSHVISFGMNFGGITGRMREIEEEEGRQIQAAKLLRKTMINEEEARIETSREYYNEALKYAEKGDFIEAQQKINSALTLNTVNIDIQALFKKLTTVAQVLPVSTGNDNMSGLIRKGVRFYIDNDAKQVVNIFQYLVEKHSGNRRLKDFMRIIKKQYPSIARQEKISAGMNLVDQKLYRALNYLYNGKYDLAINECKAVLDVEPENVAALTRMGSASYVLGQEEKALRMWMKALEVDPENIELREFLEQKGLDLAELRKKDAKREKELKAFENSMTYYYKKEGNLSKEDRIKMLKRIIKKHEETGVDISKAGSELKKIEKINDIKKKLNKKTGEEAKEQETGKKELSAEEKTALKKKYYGAGLAFKKRGEYKKAITEFEKLLEIDPGHPQSRRQVQECGELIK